MRCFLALVAVCATVSALVQGAPHVGHGQATFQDVTAPDAVPEPDFVDTLVDEARAKHVPLDKHLNVVDDGKAATAMNAADKLRANQLGWKWESCSDENNSYAIDVESIELNPDPPQPGKNLTITAAGVSHSEIKDGTIVDIEVRLGLIRLLTRHYDACEQARELNTTLQCPLPPGRHTITHTVELPRQIPPAKFNIDVRGQTQDEKPLICLGISVSFISFLASKLRSWFG